MNTKNKIGITVLVIAIAIVIIIIVVTSLPKKTSTPAISPMSTPVPSTTSPTTSTPLSPTTSPTTSTPLPSLSPSSPNLIQNGNFSQPAIGANTWQNITGTQVSGWFFQNANLLNTSSDWLYPRPYPGGNQCVSIQNTGSIYQYINLVNGVTYTITLSACSRPCCNTTNQGNPLKISCLNTNNQGLIYGLIPPTPLNTWTNVSTQWTPYYAGMYTFKIEGINTTGDQSTAIANVAFQRA